MGRRLLLFVVMCGCLYCNTGQAAETTPAKKPNILWIVGENLKLDLGCYGAENVKTPHKRGQSA